MKLTYDKGSDAVTIIFEIEDDYQVLKYDHIEGEWPINVDISTTGKVIGLEILDAPTVLNMNFIDKKSHPKSKVDLYKERKKIVKTKHHTAIPR